MLTWRVSHAQTRWVIVESQDLPSIGYLLIYRDQIPVNTSGDKLLWPKSPAPAPTSFPPSKFSFSAQPKRWSSRYMHSRKPVAFSRGNLFDPRDLHPGIVNTILYGWAVDLFLNQTYLTTIPSSTSSYPFIGFVGYISHWMFVPLSKLLLQGITKFSQFLSSLSCERLTPDVVGLTLNYIGINVCLVHLQVLPLISLSYHYVQDYSWFGGFFRTTNYIYIYIPCVREHHFSAPLMSLHIQNTPKNHHLWEIRLLSMMFAAIDVSSFKCYVVI